MSAVETMPETVAFGEVLYIGSRAYRAIVVNGKDVGHLGKDVSGGRDSWWAFIYGNTIFGTGDTPAEAIGSALGCGLARLQETIDRAKALSVEHGDELMKLAEGLI